jgi:hypothetical protein
MKLNLKESLTKHKHTLKNSINKLDKRRHHLRTSKDEILAFVISILSIAFIVSFDKWGEGQAFNFGVGILNYIKYLIIAFFVVSLHILVIKKIALHYGFRAEYKLWWYGIIIGFLLCFVSATLTSSLSKVTIIWFLAPGGIYFHHLSARRLGWFRYGMNVKESALACLFGSYSTLLLGLFFKILLIFNPGSTFLYELMSICLWFAVFTMLPFPPLNGLRVFYYSRLVYTFNFGIILGAGLLLKLNLNIFILIFLSLVVGLIFWLFNLKGEGYF